MSDPKPDIGSKRAPRPRDGEVFDRLFRDFPDGACVSDSRFRVFYLNPAAQRILGLAVGDVENATICELIGSTLPMPGAKQCPEYCPLKDKASRVAAVTQHAQRLRIRCSKLPPGLVKNHDGYHLTFIEDVAAELDLERHKEEWRETLAHDLRTPLAVIQMSLVALRKTPPETRLSLEARNFINASVSSGERMMRLLDLYLDIAKLEVGALPIRKKPLVLLDILKNVSEEQAALALARKIAIQINVAPGIQVIADPDILFRVVENILNNAIKYTPEGGKVEASSALLSDGMVGLSFKDNGPGIAPEDLPHVFDRFYQGRARRAGKTKGTGLGLAFCQQAMKSLGGRIYVTSTSGAGSDFIIHLPFRRQGQE